MAQATDAAVPAAGLYPLPPPFYTAYTDASLARLEELREAGPSQATSGAEARQALDPHELEELHRLRAQLLPPDVKIATKDGRWVSFGQMHLVSNSHRLKGMTNKFS